MFLSAVSTNIGKVLTYFVIALFCLMAMIWTYHTIYETKGRSLENILQLFMQKSSHPSQSTSLDTNDDYNNNNNGKGKKFKIIDKLTFI